MPLPASRHVPEEDTRGCFCCGKPLTREQMQDEKLRQLMMDESGEFRFVHSACTINHHVQTRVRLSEVMCATCGLVFKDNHMLESGEEPKCRDGRTWSRAPDVPDLSTDLTASPVLRSA